jgi:dihydropteroate synthase
MHWRLARTQVRLDSPCYLAILNLTPDSFSDGAAHIDPSDAADRAKLLLAQGARIIDIGAESTRPGACRIDAREEWARLAPVVEILRRENPDALLGIDTRHHEVAHKALEAGIDVINDVTGFQDAKMLGLVRISKCGLVAARARVRDGQIWRPDYSDPTPKSADQAIQEMRDVRDRLLLAGFDPMRVLLDPGFGFGTTFLEDRAIWDSLHEIPTLLDWPVERLCIGISRKRLVARSSGVGGNPALDEKTADMHTIAVGLGYRVFRTHSVS